MAKGDEIMTGTLDGKRALVIGGGSGLGLGSARLLARDGADVTIAGRTKDKLDFAADNLLAREGLSLRTVVTDALDSHSVKAAVDAASLDGKLDIAVVVPGSGSIRPVLLYDDEQFSQEVDLNVRPVYLTLKYSGQAMVRNGGGSFVAISSTAASFTARFLASYAAGKAAVDQLVRVAADELGEANVRVNSVRPGLTRTPGTDSIFADSAMVAAFVAAQPINRSGEIDDVAQAVRYLAGPESSWVTGQLLTVDGGHTLRSFPDYRDLLPVSELQNAPLGEASSEDG
jgi:NAD(P)-dependent dehydrogenase (short-subunit alcohol dehydrogenase family)